MRHLLDTNVVSELLAARPEERVIRWIDSIDPNGVYLSVITIGEICKGVEKLPDSRRKDTVRRWLSEDLLIRFEGRILELDVGATLTWGALTGRLENEGRRMPAVDSLIAALALHHDLALATRNERDFRDIGVEVINPWNWEPDVRH